MLGFKYAMCGVYVLLLCLLVKFGTLVKQFERAGDLYVSIIQIIVVELCILYFDVYIFRRCMGVSDQEMDEWNAFL